MSSTANPRRRGGRWPVVIAWLAVILLVVVAVLMGGSGPAYQMD